MRTKSFLGVFLIVFAAALAGGGLYGANYLKQPKFDSETLCPLSGPVAATLIIIDKTGGLTPLEQDRVRAIVTSGSNSIEKAKLILVSDLMEHTPQASAYDGSFTVATLRKLISRDTQVWLRSAQVELVILPRAQYAGRQRAAITVWRQFLKETGGRDFILQSL
jgi:hypothetical protein